MGRDIDLEGQYDKIYRYCYFKVRQRETAEDITQQTFLRFLESGTYENTGRALQYLYTSARNLCIDEYRMKKHAVLSGEFLEESGFGGCYSAQKAVADGCVTGMEEQLVVSVALRAALEELSEEERELVLLRYVNEVPMAVICKLSGMSRFAVYRRLREALKLLREKLGEEDFT